jgi:hypothetical protein
MTTNEGRCEPGPEWRERDGWHWVANAAGREAPIRWNAGVSGWWDDPVPIGPEYAHREGYRYLAPCPPPATVAALVEALEVLNVAARHASLHLAATEQPLLALDRAIIQSRDALAAYREAGR